MKLRDYQDDISDKAVVLLNKWKIAYLALETRTGKTITALATCSKYEAERVLFVTKKKAISSVVSDSCNFKNLEVTVINYESVAKFASDYDVIICDEAHGLGAYPKPAKRVKDLISITKKKPIIFLSATPAPESHSQFYHQFYISSFSPFKDYVSFYKWSKIYTKDKVKHIYNREVRDYSDANMKLIKKDIDHLFLRLTQKEAGFDVTIDEQILKVPLSDIQKVIIKNLRKNKIVKGKSGSVIIADTAVKMQNKIHQICSGTIIDESGAGKILSKNKAEFLRKYFDGHKIVIFYKFKAELEVLKQVFENYTTEPEEFQKSKDKTYLGQFVSSREGIRLDTADSIVFYNIDFSYLSYAQAKDRIISKERTKQAVLYWCFSIGGIEEMIYRTVKNKQDYTSFIFKKDYQWQSQ